jgi:hypothetical protein
MWFNTSSTIPSIVANHTQSMENITSQFTESLKDERRLRREEIDMLKSYIRTEATCHYNRDQERTP